MWVVIEFKIKTKKHGSLRFHHIGRRNPAGDRLGFVILVIIKQGNVCSFAFI
jgi:hypothetical protein